jgi:RNA polymerase sigma factor (sigma-70 family)
MDKYTENELVSLLKTKDQKVFSYLYENYAPALHGLILTIVQNPEHAGDLLQETFVNIWCKIHTYDNSKGRVFTWMLHVARNLSIDLIRSKHYRNSLQTVSLGEEEEYCAEHILPLIDIVGIKIAVGQLKPKYSRLVDLAYFKGYTQEQIAAMEDLPIGTIKTRIRTALVQLRGYL